MIKWFIRIKDIKTNKEWVEEFDSPYLHEKRITKLKHSKNLIIKMTWRET